MKIKDILNNKRLSISFEVFPPKETYQFDNVKLTVDKLSKLKPDYISVTYGAGGGTSANTVKIADYIQNSLNISSLAHMTCVSSTQNQVKTLLDELRNNKIENILALRGDIPDGLDFPSPRYYQYAMQLIEDIKKSGYFCIGGACYPEGHIESNNREEDLCHLKEKVDAGLDFLVTQLFFDNDMLYNFLYRLFQKNINVPVIAGIMPVTNKKSINKMCKLSGSTLTPKYRAMLDRFENCPESLKQAGIAFAIEQIIDLISNGVKGIHIYTMNKPEIAESIISGISEIIRESQV